jgi:hypothetical protein
MPQKRIAAALSNPQLLQTTAPPALVEIIVHED